MKTQEKNKAIAEWLGYECIDNPLTPNMVSIKIDNYEKLWHPDKDRNQQKLIEDKLIEINCFVQYTYDDFKKEWEVYLDNSKNKTFTRQSESKDIAFIDAVIELIQNEKA